MKTACSLLLTLVAVTLVATACGGGSSSSVDTTPSAQADALRDRVVAAMSNVDSYHAVFTSGDYSFETDFQRPNSYRSAVVVDDDETGEPTRGETIELGDTVYARKCDPDGSDCGAWESAARKEARVGLGSYDPGWPIIALGMADDVSYSDGVLRGFVNQIRAVLAYDKRLFEAADATPRYGCGGSSQNTPDADGCRALTYEDAFEGQEPGVSFIDEHPSRIDLEIDPKTYLLKSFTITMIRENTDAEPGEQSVETNSVSFTYSEYNEITIEAPE